MTLYVKGLLMFNQLIFSIILSLAGVTLAFAQTATLSGTVTDARTGNVIPGVNIFFPELDRGGVTDSEGVYSIGEIPAGTYTITVSFIGYQRLSLELAISPGVITRNIELRADLIGMNEIFVTAQQIERERREIGYSIQTVRAEEMIRARETNFIDALAGKVAGVDVISQSGNVGGSSRIVLRGISSLSGNNQPLFVVDGVPVSNANIVGPTSQDRRNGAIDVGNRGADLNPDDIESVTVLKGTAAAATYGQRAKNGVILITTKRGAAGEDQRVTVNSSVRIASPLKLPSFQNRYAQGSNGKFDVENLNGWGPLIDGQIVEDFRGEEVQLQAFENNVRDFYRDALTTINSVSFSDADERSDFRLGVTHQGESGIMPGSNQNRTSIALNTGRRVTQALTARLSGSYVNTGSTGRAVAGGNDPNVLASILNTMPRNIDNAVLRNYKDEEGNQIPMSDFVNNPYWVANENQFTSDIERLYGNTALHLSPNDWLTLNGRAGIDVYTENRRNVNVVGTKGREDGLFTLDAIQERQLNIDLNADLDRAVTGDLYFSGVFGYNLNTQERTIQRNRAERLTVGGLFNFANAESNSPTNQLRERRLFGVFGDVTLGFREYLFLNLTGRNDWSSTLPKDNNSFFYPSANVSFIFTEAFDVREDLLSYGKLRVNYAQVGSDEEPFQLAFTFSPVSQIFGQINTGNTFPFGGQIGFDATSTIPPTDLKPQNQISWEVGTELQFFQGRFGLDFTWYDSRTEDQILSLPVPQSTGFFFNRMNVGEVKNEGVEAALNITPVRTRRVDWTMNLNFAQNRNTVVSLAEGVDQINIQSAFSALQVKAEPGKSLGLYGPGFERDPVTGKPVIDPNTGLRLKGEVIRLGSTDPDFRVGFANTLNYRNVNMSFLLDWRQGGVLFSNTVGSMRRNGTAEETLRNREGTFIDDGVIVVSRDEGGNITETRPNDVPVANMQSFWQRFASSGIHEGNTFPATYVKLREVSLGYTLPGDWMERVPVHSVRIGFEARNLFLLYSEIPHIDPETGLFGSASNGQGIEWDVLPSVRSFGTNIQVRF